MKSPRIFFVSAPCGAGKTHSACEYIKSILDEKNALYVAPSCHLLSETYTKLEAMGVPLRMITHETDEGHVHAAIMETLRDAPDEGVALLITWQSFVDLPFFPKRENWQVIVDEIPQIDHLYPFNVPYSRQYVNDHIELGQSINERLGLVTPINKGQLRSYLNHLRDEARDRFKPFLQHVLSPNWDVFVETAQYTSILEREETYRKDEDNRIYFLAVLKPGFLRNAIILGAHFEDSLLYDWFKRYHGVRFEPCNDIVKGLRDDPASNREIEIRYFLEDRYFSKLKANKMLPNGEKLIESMDRQAASLFGVDPFLYVTNKNRTSEALQSSPNAREIPVQSHGLNCYADYHNIYFSAALNREPKHLNMLSGLGFSLRKVHSATTHEVMYQDAMRTSLRCPDANNLVRIVVPDRDSAKRLGELLGAQTVSKLGDIVSPRLKPLTQVEKNQRSKAQKIRKQLFEPKQLPISFIKKKGNQFGREGNPPTLFVTFHETVYASTEEEHSVRKLTVPEFIRKMRAFSTAIVTEKESRFLFNPARYDPTKNPEAGYRTKDNLVEVSMLTLDFDGGKLSPEQFEDIFWHRAGKGQKRSFAICNTFSRKPSDINRFRVMMFFKEPAKSVDEFEAVFDAIVQKLAEEGFPEAESGLDTGSRSGVHSFFLPGVNREYPHHAFFRPHGTTSKEVARYGIDPSSYLKTKPAQKPPRTWGWRVIAAGDLSKLPKELEDLKSRIGCMPYGSHLPVFRLAVALRNYFRGDLAAVEFHLNEVTGSDPRKRRMARGALASLRRSRTARTGSLRWCSSPQNVNPWRSQLKKLKQCA